jgi:hypothetical protein
VLVRVCEIRVFVSGRHGPTLRWKLSSSSWRCANLISERRRRRRLRHLTHHQLAAWGLSLPPACRVGTVVATCWTTFWTLRLAAKVVIQPVVLVKTLLPSVARGSSAGDEAANGDEVHAKKIALRHACCWFHKRPLLCRKRPLLCRKRPRLPTSYCGLPEASAGASEAEAAEEGAGAAALAATTTSSARTLMRVCGPFVSFS